MNQVLEKEVVNREKAEIMKNAILEICEMSEEEIQKIISNHQTKVLKKAEMEALVKASHFDQLKDIPFSMVGKDFRFDSVTQQLMSLIGTRISNPDIKGQFMIKMNLINNKNHHWFVKRF